MSSIEEAKKTMYELDSSNKFEELIKYYMDFFKGGSQNLSYFDKIELLQYKENALRKLGRHVEADQVNIEIMNLPKDVN